MNATLFIYPTEGASVIKFEVLAETSKAVQLKNTEEKTFPTSVPKKAIVKEAVTIPGHEVVEILTLAAWFFP